MHVVLQPSPSITHKYRVTLPNKRAIDFGQTGVQYFPDHRNPRLMRAQLLRKGAIIPKELRIERDQYEIQRGCRNKKVRKRTGKISSGPNIGRDGYYTLTLMWIRLNCI